MPSRGSGKEQPRSGGEPASTRLLCQRGLHEHLKKKIVGYLSTDIAPIAFGEPAKKRHGYQSTEI